MRAFRTVCVVALIALIYCSNVCGQTWITVQSGFEDVTDGQLDRQLDQRNFRLAIYPGDYEPFGVIFVENIDFSLSLSETVSFEQSDSAFRLSSHVTTAHNYYRFYGNDYAEVPSDQDLNAAEITYRDITLPTGESVTVPYDVVSLTGDLATRGAPVYRIQTQEPVDIYIDAFGTSLGEEFSEATLFLRSLNDSGGVDRDILSYQAYSPTDGHYQQRVSVGNQSFLYDDRNYTRLDPAPTWNEALSTALAESVLISSVSGSSAIIPSFSGRLPPGTYELGTTGWGGCDGDTCGPVTAGFNFHATPVPEPTNLLLSISLASLFLMKRLRAASTSNYFPA